MGESGAVKAAATTVGSAVGAQQAKKKIALGNLRNQGNAGRGLAEASQVKGTNEQERREREELDKMLEENRRKVEEAQRREALEQQQKELERYHELERIQRQKEEALQRKRIEEEEERVNQMKLLGCKFEAKIFSVNCSWWTCWRPTGLCSCFRILF